MIEEEIVKFAELSEALASAEESQAGTLLASAAHRRLSCSIIRQLIDENKSLRESKNIVNNTFNAPVGIAVGSVEQLSPCQPLPSLTTSMPPSDNTSTTLTK